MASIGSVGTSDYAYQNAQTATVAATTTATPATTTPVATTDTKSDNTVASNSAAVYETTATDKDKTAAAAKQQRTQMLKEADEKAEQFKKLILSIVDKQGKTSAKALPDSNLKDFYQSLTVSDEDRAKAQQDISEDGYYGVKETSKRIMDMAKSFAGSDPATIQKMRDSVEKGFKDAEKAWGGELPEISKQTYKNVMDQFDEWQKSTSPSGTSSSGTSSSGTPTAAVTSAGK